MYRFVQSQDGSIWIGAWGGGLNCFKDGHLTAYGKADGLSSSFVRALHEGRDGSLWIVTDYRGGLNRLRDGRFTHYGAQHGLTAFAILALLDDADGNIWIGSREGLFRLKGAEVVHYTQRDGLSHNKINALCEDGEGQLWIGTDSGLTRWNGRSFSQPTPRPAKGVPVLDYIVVAFPIDNDSKSWAMGLLRDGWSDITVWVMLTLSEVQGNQGRQA